MATSGGFKVFMCVRISAGAVFSGRYSISYEPRQPPPRTFAGCVLTWKTITFAPVKLIDAWECWKHITKSSRDSLPAKGPIPLSIARKTHIHLLVPGWRGLTPVHRVVNNLTHPCKPPLRAAASILSGPTSAAGCFSVEAEFHLIDTI